MPVAHEWVKYKAARLRLLRACSIIGDCWVWTGVQRNGYGIININGRTRNAHRAAYALFVADVPYGQSVLRNCGNSLCCNPEHLYLDVQEKPLSAVAAESWHDQRV